MYNPRMASLLLLSFLAAAVCLCAQPPLPYQVDRNWPQLPEGWNFNQTPGVAVDARGHVYVIHRGAHSILEFTAEGELVRAFGEDVFKRPHAIRIDPEGYLWTVDDTSNDVLKIDPSGRIRMVLTTFSRGGIPIDPPGRKTDPASFPAKPGIRDAEIQRFNRPTDIAFGPDGSIYVTDGYGNSRVVKFARDGTFLTTWGRKGAGEGEFNTPHSIVVDRRGRVYVGDRENYRIQIFDAGGKFLEQWKHVGAPWGLDLTPEQELYMADGYNNRVLKLDLEGNVLGILGGPGKLPGQFSFAHHLAVAPDAIYVTEILNWRVQKFVRRR